MKNLLNSTSMTPLRILPARIRKDENGHTGLSPVPGELPPANTQQQQNPTNQGNNPGPDADLEAFWAGPQAPAAAPITNQPVVPANPAAPPAATPPAEQGFAQQFQQRMADVKFEPVIDAAVTAELEQGNYTEFNKRLEASHRHTMQNAVILATQVVQEFSKVIKADFERQMNGTLTNRDNNEALESKFPAAKDPLVRPMIQQVYDQALKNVGGDRDKATALTKRMLARMTGTVAPDVDYSIAPRNPGDQPQPSTPNFLEWFNQR